MKIALMQMNTVWEDKGENLKKAEDLMAKAYKAECDIAVFPEMFSTGFSMNTVQIAEKPNGFLLNRLKKIAKERSMSIIAGMAESAGKNYENKAYAIDDQGSILASYTKNYSFSYSGEDKKYHAGNKQEIFEIDDVPSSLFICYDLRFPELFRKVAKSVSMIFVIANWPDSRIDHWNALVKARAIENQCFIIAVNRIGTDGNGLSYSGGSQIINPMGQQVESLFMDEELIIIDIDERETDFVRERFPFLKDLKEGDGRRE